MNIIALAAFGQSFLDRACNTIIDSAKAFEAAGLHPVIFTDTPIQGFHCLAPPDRILEQFAGAPAMLARWCKIHALELLSCHISICADADLTLETPSALPALLDTAARFGFVVTHHPSTTWFREPLTIAQRLIYYSDQGMIQYAPLYMCGVVARDHRDDRARTLSTAWAREFDQHAVDSGDVREQPTLAAASWACGVAPLASPLSLLAWPQSAQAHCPPVWRHTP